MKRVTLLIDGDILAYKAAAVSTTEIMFDDGDVVTDSDLDHAKRYVQQRLQAWEDELKTKHMLICLSDSSNWRKTIYPAYKANRPPSPQILSIVRKYVADTLQVKHKEGLEADDVMGILSTHPSLIKGEKIIVSEDKDMNTIPGLLYNPNDPKAGVIEVSKFKADKYHLQQVLTGDTVDNYPGCPGIGPVKASAILDVEPCNMWDAVVDAFEAAGLPEEEALIQARIARICRASDYDFKRKRVKLWNP